MKCRVLADSLLSTLLFVFIAVLVQDENKKNRFGYADNIATLFVGKIASEAVVAT